MGALFPFLFDVPKHSTNLNVYLKSLSFTVWDKFNETVGNLINYGSDGNTATVTACVQGQTGQLGLNEAYSFDGLTSIVAHANADVPLTKALTTQRWVFLVKANTLGETNQGRFFQWTTTANYLCFFTLNRMFAGIHGATADATINTNNNQVDFVGNWALVFMDYDDANTMGLGRRIRLFRASLTQPTTLLTNAVDTPTNGVVNPAVGALNIGNNAATTTTFDGLMDMAAGGAGLWTPPTSPTNLLTMETIRKLVFNP